MEWQYTILDEECTISVENLLADCVDIEKFLVLCKGCPNYGNRWSCPPYAEDVLSVWLRYQELQLVIRMVKPMSSMTEGEALKVVGHEREALSQYLLKREKETPGTLALVAGPCTNCGETCARKHGQPCESPQKLRYSIESIGGDVSKITEKYFGKTLLWIENGVLPEYFLLVGGLFRNHRSN